MKLSELKDFYLSEWCFFRKKLLPLFLLVVFCFVALALATYLFHKGDSEGLRPWMEELMKRKGWPSTLPPFLLCLKIFVNNLKIDLFCVFLGYIPFVFCTSCFFCDKWYWGWKNYCLAF